MAAKDDNIRRLQDLAVLLGRKADISGSAAEIQQRVMEWEEEASDLDDNEAAPHTSNNIPDRERSLTGWVAVRVLKTIHVPALTLDGHDISDAVTAGERVQIQGAHLHELEAAGLVSET